MNTLTAENWNYIMTRFEVGQTVLVHDDDGTLWTAPIADITDDGLLHLVSDETDAFESPSICEVELDGARTRRFANDQMQMPDTQQFDYLVEVAAWADAGATEYIGVIGQPSRHVLEKMLASEVSRVRKWVDAEASAGHMDARTDEPQVALIRQRPEADEDGDVPPSHEWPVVINWK